MDPWEEGLIVPKKCGTTAIVFQESQESIVSQIRRTNMKQRGKTNRLKAKLKRNSVKKNLRKSRGESKYSS
jgi:hypothetical protein